MKKEEKRASPKLPDWFKNDLASPFRAGISSMFIAHGNINCLMPNTDEDKEEKPYISLRQFWEEQVFRSCKMVIFYDIASGVRFADPEMEKDFLKAAGIENDDAKSKPDDPLAAAIMDMTKKEGIPREPESALPLIEKVLENTEKVAVIINSLHFIAPSSGMGVNLSPTDRVNIERIRNWSQNKKLKENGNIVVMLTEEISKVATELKTAGIGINQFFIPKPAKEERKNFIEILIEQSRKYNTLNKALQKMQEQIKKSKSEEKREQLEGSAQEIEEEMSSCSISVAVPKNLTSDILAHATQGMNLQQILEIFLQAQVSEKPLSFEYVKQKKREILNQEYGELIEVLEPKRGLDDIGGMEHIKSYFRNILGYINKGEYRLVPMGVTLMGPPGTGKTAFVESLAFEAGFNFIKSKSIRSMWVGESEARMEKFIYALRSLAPVVVMNDEADLGEANRDAPKGDSGVSERLMKMWMEFLSDPRIRGQVIVISCTNRADRIDPALKRSGRSDELILLPMPSINEIPEIFKVMFARHKIPSKVSDIMPFAKLADGRSGADIEKIVLNSFRFAFEQGRGFVDDQALKNAIYDSIPSASQADIDRMTMVGILESSSRRLLPPNIKEILKHIIERRLVNGLDAMLEEVKTRNIIDLAA